MQWKQPKRWQKVKKKKKKKEAGMGVIVKTQDANVQKWL